MSKFVGVIGVSDLTNSETVDLGLALIKLKATPAIRMEVMERCNVFHAKIVDLSEQTVTLEVTGRPDKIDAMLSTVRK